MGLAVSKGPAGSMHYSGAATSLIDWEQMDDAARQRLWEWLGRTWPGWRGLVSSGYRRPIFDWKRDCPDAVGAARPFPAVVGPGRGVPLGSVRPRR